MALIEKEIIGPATYYYTDETTGQPRKLVVTPNETKYWCEQGNKMLSGEHPLTVPVPCEHDFQAHPMTPAQKLKDNAGWVKEYRVKDAADGRKDVLFGVVDITDAEVARKLPHTIRWTSPWISSFTDGQGRDWKNVISHLALTTRPRITKQAPFSGIAAALSMATTAKIGTTGDKGFCLSKAGTLVEHNSHLMPKYPVAFSLYSGIVLGEEDVLPPPKKKKEGGAGGEPEPPGEAAEGDMPEIDGPLDAEAGGAPDMPPEVPGDDFGDMVGDVQMEEVLADLLGALGIHLERSGGEAMFKKSLYNAAMVKVHELTSKAQGQDQGMGDTNNQPPTGANQTPPNPLIQQEQQPMYMSLQDIHKIPDPVMKKIALNMYQENAKLSAALALNEKVVHSIRDAKLKEEKAKRSGRVHLLSRLSPRVKADLDAMVAMPSMALSMGDGGAVIDPMAQTLAVLEKGLADMPRLLTTDQTALSVAGQPTDADQLSEEESDKIADGLARNMGCPPVARKAS